MLFVSFFFALFAPVVGPFIFGIWLLLFLLYGPLSWLSSTFSKVSVRHNALPAAKIIRCIKLGSGIYIIVIPSLCYGLLFIGHLRTFATNIFGNENLSTILTCLYSPISVILIFEAWLVLLSYLGLNYLSVYLNLSQEQVKRNYNIFRSLVLMTGLLTWLIGYGWWVRLALESRTKFETISNFTLVELSPTLVILTFGFIVALGANLNIYLPNHIFELKSRLTLKRYLFNTIIFWVLLTAVGVSISVLIHYNRFVFNNL